VIVGCGLLRSLGELVKKHAPAHRYAVISDSNVAPLYGDATLRSLSECGLDAELFTFAAGERHKNRATWVDLTDRFFAAGIGRDSCVVALGGGVTGDLAGFVAATYMRGIPVVQVPTSLVAMVDASVGGKTGVDVAAGKNLVGAFHPPLLVVADPEAVVTLPRAARGAQDPGWGGHCGGACGATVDGAQVRGRVR
jgi:3-dehydroquinate synthase